MLIVEDQAYMRGTLRKFVQSAFPGKTIYEAANGASALALGRERRPTVVLMDIDLPDANGIELTAQLKQMLPETAVIIVTTYTATEYRMRAAAAGAFAYVAKDAVDQELIPAIQAALTRHLPSKEHT